MNCTLCNWPIKKGTKTKPCKDGRAHAACYERAISSLSDALRAHMMGHPELYERLPSGAFRLKPEMMPKKLSS